MPKRDAQRCGTIVEVYAGVRLTTRWVGPDCQYGMSLGMSRCELCELAPTTPWYAQHDEPFRFTLLDCDSCDVPMAVLGEHRAVPSDAERAVMQAALGGVADTKYPRGWFFDDHMRQIPDHYHLHARPYPVWWTRRS